MKREKYHKYILLFISILFLIPISAIADQPTCAINLAKNSLNTVAKGDTVSINLGTDSSSTNMFIYKLNYSIWYDKSILEIVKENNHYVNTIDNWGIENETLENNLSFTAVTTNKFQMIAGKNNVASSSIATIKFKVKEDANISEASTKIELTYPSSYDFYDSESPYTDPLYDNTTNYACEISSVIIYLNSNVNTLANIKLDNHDIEDFDPDRKTYSLIVDGSKETINIEAIKKDPKSSISGDLGTKTLKYGINSFNIDVTSENNSKNTYTLYITREDNRSKINTLKTLKIATVNFDFKPDVNSYDLTVKNEVEKITITSSLTDSKAKYKEDFTKREIELLEGINKVEITIIAENGTENTYTLNIIRELSSNNTLKELYVNNEKISLYDNAFSYNYYVSNDITSVSVQATPTDPNAKVIIDNLDNLNVGENEINIYVTASNGDKVGYTLYVVRENATASDSSVRNIIIDGYNLNFDKSKTYYTLKIKKEESLNIEVIREDQSQTVEIEGNDNLINGSIIKINVKAENGAVTRYFITIEKSNNSFLIWLIIIIILLIIIGVVIVFIIKKKKGNMPKEDDKPVNDDKEEEPKKEEQQEENETNEEKEKASE